MRTNRSIPDAAIIPVLAYADLSVAVPWLCAAFGASERLRIADHRVQLHLAGGAFVAKQAEVDPATIGDGHSIMVRIADADAHCAQARGHGAHIAMEPTSFSFGERQYAAIDCGGHRWTFTQTIDDADPAAWGGELVRA